MLEGRCRLVFGVFSLDLSSTLLFDMDMFLERSGIILYFLFYTTVFMQEPLLLSIVLHVLL